MRRAGGRRSGAVLAAAAVAILSCRPGDRSDAPTKGPPDAAASGPVRLEIEASAVPLNKDFSVRIVLDPAAFKTPIQREAITLEAMMPEHGHGMNVTPIIRPTGEPGVFVAERLLFHMRGKWRLVVRVQDGDRTVEATRDLEI